MTIDQIRQLYEARPFQPFVIHMADGREILVEHPEFMGHAPSGRTVVVYQPNDSVNIIEPLLVTDLELKPQSNGKRRRR